MISGGCNRVACWVGTLTLVPILTFQGKCKNGQFAEGIQVNLHSLPPQDLASVAFTPLVEYGSHSCYPCWV